MQDDLREVRVGAVAVVLPILRSGVNLDITAHAYAIDFYFSTQKIRSDTAVPFTEIQYLYLAVAQSLPAGAQQSAVPERLNFYLVGQRKFVIGFGTAIAHAHLLQQAAVSISIVLSVIAHGRRYSSPPISMWRCRSSSSVSHT